MSVFLRNIQNLASQFFIILYLLLVFTAACKDCRNCLCCSYNLRCQWCSQMGIADNTHRISAVFQSAGEHRIICQHSSHSNHNSCIFQSLFLYMNSGSFSCHPFGFTCISGNFSIHSHCIFHDHIRFFILDVIKECFIQFITLFF